MAGRPAAANWVEKDVFLKTLGLGTSTRLAIIQIGRLISHGMFLFTTVLTLTLPVALSVFFVPSVNDTGQNRETTRERGLTGPVGILGGMFYSDTESHPCTGKLKNWKVPS